MGEIDINVIVNFFKTYGWQLSLLAFSGIVILGLLKWFGCFKKLNDKYKKYVYFGLSVIISILSCTIYIFVVNQFNWANYGILCLAIVGFTLTIYGLYEHTGLRTAWKKLVLDNIAKFFKFVIGAIVSGTLSKDKLKEKALSLGSETLNELVTQAKEIEKSTTEVKQ